MTTKGNTEPKASMTQPKPFRCETCNFFKPQQKHLCPGYYGQKMKRDEQDRTTIMDFPYEFTAKVGCSSHSEANQRIDAVIKMLEGWEKCKMVDLTDGSWYSEVGLEMLQEAIALLRGEQP